MPHHPPQAAELLRAIRQLRRIKLHKASVAGLKPSEVSLLFRLRYLHQDGLKVTEISSMLRVTSPTVTQLVNTLEAHGLLERAKDAEDGRIVRIKLTSEGTRVSLLVEQEILGNLQGVIDHLGADRSRLLIELLDEVFQYLEGKDAVCSAAPPKHSVNEDHSENEGDPLK